MKRKPPQVLMPYDASSAKIISYLKTLHTKASAPTASDGYKLRASSLIPCPTKNGTVDKNSSDGNEDVEDRNIPRGPSNGTTKTKEAKKARVSLLDSVCWKQFGVVVAKHVTKCSVAYWLLDVSQVPSMLPVSRKQSSLSRIVGGLLSLCGGFIMGPLFLEIGILPQVSSAASTFIITFSSSIFCHCNCSAALYFAAATIISAVIGQNSGGKVIKALGRTYLIILILAFTTLGSTVSLGRVGVPNMVKQIEHKEYIGFERKCSQGS
ncbi:hypothetical protein PRUPE_3G066000 [Prunus persica]|uniref:Uncharacterized protein n=1 Tax=Prunus persica TaxID=3760 RepID=M5XAR5_PRUPE|nr:hypothetical protein PRUPE_3G066000 [Prunus persica]